MGRGRAPCCEKIGLNKGSWTPEEDMRLMAYIHKYGHANWRALPKQAGLLRCGKSCRLRWINYLRPDIKRGNFAKEEEDTIIKLHGLLGNKWSKIASLLPGRTDNEIKNVWNTHLKKRLSPPNVRKQDKSQDPPSSQSSITTDTNIEPNCAVGEDSDKIEIPIESNLDLWEMLDDVTPPKPSNLSPCSSSSNMVVLKDDPMEEIPDISIEPELWSIIDNNLDIGAISCHDQNSTNYAEEPSGEGDSERWLAYLEKELELWGESDEKNQVLNAEVEGGDPVTSYFQRTTSSPFPLDDLLY